MRTLAILTILTLILAPTGQAMHILYYFGDGEEHTEDPTSIATGDNTARWPMVETLEGSAETTFVAPGYWNVDADELGVIPTFVWENPVSLDGSTPVVVSIDWMKPGNNGCGNNAQLFDLAGNLLGPEDGPAPVGEPGTSEPARMEYFFEGIAGDFDGLKVQFSQSLLSCGGGTVWYWGSEEYDGHVNLGIPHEAVPEGPAVQMFYVDLAEPVLNIEHRFNGTSDIYQYNWTNDHGALNFSYQVAATNGSVDVLIVDADGAEVLNTTIGDSFQDNGTLEEAAIGNWTIHLAYSEFVGNVSLDLSAFVPPSDDGEDDEPIEDPGDDPDDGNETTDPPASEESPSVPVVLLGVAVLGLALLRRRD